MPNLDINRFPHNTHITPPDFPRALGDHLLFHSRWWLHIQLSRIVIRSGRKAKRGNYSDRDWVNSSLGVFSAIERAGGRFHISGLDNIRHLTKPVVFISNHMSTLETVIFPGLIVPFVRATFVIKDSLLHYPYFGHILKSRDAIAVSRNNSRQDLVHVLQKGKELLGGGVSVIIFPQSTRYSSLDPEKFNSLGIKLARNAGVGAIPVAIKTDFWETGKWLKDFGPIHREKTIHIEFGKEMAIEGTGKEQHANTLDFIARRLEQWNREEKS